MGTIREGAEANRDTEILELRIDSELLRLVKKKAGELDTDVPTFITWCIRTGFLLSDLNSFVRSKMREES